MNTFSLSSAPDAPDAAPDGGPDLTAAEKISLKTGVVDALESLDAVIGTEMLNELSPDEIRESIENVITLVLFDGKDVHRNASPSDLKVQKFAAAQSFLSTVVGEYLKKNAVQINNTQTKETTTRTTESVSLEIKEAFEDERLAYYRENPRAYIHAEKNGEFVVDGEPQSIDLKNALFADFGPLRAKMAKKNITEAKFLQATEGQLPPAMALRLLSYIENGAGIDGLATTKDVQEILFHLDTRLAGQLQENSKDVRGVDDKYGYATMTAVRMIDMDSIFETISAIEEIVDGFEYEIEEEIEEESTEPEIVWSPKTEMQMDTVETPTAKRTTEEEYALTSETSRPLMLETEPFDVNKYKYVGLGYDLSGSKEKALAGDRKKSDAIIENFNAPDGKIAGFGIRDHEQDFVGDRFASAMTDFMDIENKADVIKTFEVDQLPEVTRQIESPLLSIDAFFKESNMKNFENDAPKVVHVFFDEKDANENFAVLKRIQRFAKKHTVDVFIDFDAGEKKVAQPALKKFMINVNQISRKHFELAKVQVEGDTRMELDYVALAEMALDPAAEEKYAQRRYSDEYARFGAFDPRKRTFSKRRLKALNKELAQIDETPEK
jgi:hypothetical protein